MGDTGEKVLPGTATAYIDRGGKGFSKIEMLLEATGGLSLSQVCAVTGLEGSTIQNWVKRGWVAHPKGKRYEEIHIARILIINALKECIKLEHISMLMSYVNSSAVGESDDFIKESELYNFLCEALRMMGQGDDHSRGGVETVVEALTKDYRGPKLDSRVRVRKALSLMIYACVCTDVKRRTETMMGQILHELEHPESVEFENEKMEKPVEAVETPDAPAEEEPEDDVESSVMARKTVSQALREWDISSVERIIIDHNEEEATTESLPDGDEKSSSKPWYLRRGSK